MKKLIVSLLLITNCFATDKSYESFCNNEEDYKKYLVEYNKYNTALIIYQKAENLSKQEKNDLLKLNIASNYFGLLYTSCFAYLQKEKTEELLTKNFK